MKMPNKILADHIKSLLLVGFSEKTIVPINNPIKITGIAQ
jgi:hypothetical protein